MKVTDVTIKYQMREPTATRKMNVDCSWSVEETRASITLPDGMRCDERGQNSG
jgi:hypothetical protein